MKSDAKIVTNYDPDSHLNGENCFCVKCCEKKITVSENRHFKSNGIEHKDCEVCRLFTILKFALEHRIEKKTLVDSVTAETIWFLADFLARDELIIIDGDLKEEISIEEKIPIKSVLEGLILDDFIIRYVRESSKKNELVEDEIKALNKLPDVEFKSKLINQLTQFNKLSKKSNEKIPDWMMSALAWGKEWARIDENNWEKIHKNNWEKIHENNNELRYKLWPIVDKMFHYTKGMSIATITNKPDLMDALNKAVKLFNHFTADSLEQLQEIIKPLENVQGSGDEWAKRFEAHMTVFCDSIKYIKLEDGIIQIDSRSVLASHAPGLALTQKAEFMLTTKNENNIDNVKELFTLMKNELSKNRDDTLRFSWQHLTDKAREKNKVLTLLLNKIISSSTEKEIYKNIVVFLAVAMQKRTSLTKLSKETSSANYIFTFLKRHNFVLLFSEMEYLKHIVKEGASRSLYDLSYKQLANNLTEILDLDEDLNQHQKKQQPEDSINETSFFESNEHSSHPKLEIIDDSTESLYQVIKKHINNFSPSHDESQSTLKRFSPKK